MNECVRTFQANPTCGGGIASTDHRKLGEFNCSISVRHGLLPETIRTRLRVASFKDVASPVCDSWRLTSGLILI